MGARLGPGSPPRSTVPHLLLLVLSSFLPCERSLSPGSDSQAPATLEPDDGVGHAADTAVLLLGPVNSTVVFTCR